MRISDWSSDACSSDLQGNAQGGGLPLDALTCEVNEGRKILPLQLAAPHHADVRHAPANSVLVLNEPLHGRVCRVRDIGHGLALPRHRIARGRHKLIKEAVHSVPVLAFGPAPYEGLDGIGHQPNSSPNAALMRLATSASESFGSRSRISRSEERRVGNECVRTVRSRWWPHRK